MPVPQGAPEWAIELYVAFESGASGQFILYGNVHDRLAVGGRLVNIERYIQDQLLASFDVVLKRPGRIDLKVPILPTTTRTESAGLIGALARRYELLISSDELREIEPLRPMREPVVRCGCQVPLAVRV